MNTLFRTALLTGSLLVMAGCDQIESSSRKVLDTAADSARQAVDQTHKAATQALDEARQELTGLEPSSDSADAERTSKKDS